MLLVFLAGTIQAQEPGQTLGAVVVVAERAPTPINQSTAAVTRLTSADLARLPYTTVADVLRRVPGFAVVDFDGSGRDPQLMVRGFYGGGEAEYVLVMVDGRVMNQVHNGTITWETLPPLSSIESIEIVRGSASTMHGDAAVAGVISIITRRPTRTGAVWQVGIESQAGISGAAEVPVVAFNDKNGTLSFGFDRTEGFRDHAARTSANARGLLRLMPNLLTSLGLSWRDFDDPGPLLASLRGDGSESDPRFRSDGGQEREWNGAVDHTGVLGAGGTVNTALRIGGRRTDLTRTLPLTPEFSDTRDRELRAFQIGLTTQVNSTPTILPPGVERVTFGASADLGTLDSRYFPTNEDGTSSENTSGDGRRAAAAAFLNFVATTTDRLRWTFGARVDYLNDAFEESEPTGLDANNSHFAFSPKFGINFRYAAAGRAWVSASRTFKAPTLDQQFDQRPIPVPFPPFTVTTSNPDLEPQRGTSSEIGLYHDFTFSSARLGVTLTLYEIAMRNELDFDVQSLKYVNISRSRHRGAEAGVTWSQGVVSAFGSLARQNAISREGDNSGRQLKAVPGFVVTGGVTVSPLQVGTVSLSVTRNSDMFIDDANTERIPAWSRVDAQFSRRLGLLTVVVGVRNLLDENYNSTAFLDPAGSGAAYVYPAAGRVITIGVRHGR
jgi:iron complex outermembrane receptor protein